MNETKTDEMVLDVINNKLKKPRAIIVKFALYKDRHRVFRNKKLLKGSSISVTESLTQKRMEHLKKAREQHGFANVWTQMGR